MKFTLIAVILCLFVLSEQQDNVIPEVQEKWSSFFEPQILPKPEKACIGLPNAYEVEYTPIVETEVTFDEQVICDPFSVFKIILYQKTIPIKLTCNGIIAAKFEEVYEAVVNGYGTKTTVTLNLTNYTLLATYNNGNNIIQECGIISSGKCSGDIFWGYGILEADSQKGCSKDGVGGVTALSRQIEITGKCASKCSLGSVAVAYSEPITNYGAVDRSIDAEEDDNY